MYVKSLGILPALHLILASMLLSSYFGRVKKAKERVGGDGVRT